ncbi:hypothetical protein [Vibrio diazotrophicus]|uniref:hypothetical protein n=1 Tax=Vibrio diazotrophicus TaxID=685 RepID=UPI00313C029D
MRRPVKPEPVSGITGIRSKPRIRQDSYWFPRRNSHKQWFLAGDTKTSSALDMSSQQLLVEEKIDHQWFENELADRLAAHFELAFQEKDLKLVLKLLSNLSSRISIYAEQFQSEAGIKELKRFKEIIENSLTSSKADDRETLKLMVGIADAWAAMASNLCLESLRRTMTFEAELKDFFNSDKWDKKSISKLPPFLQVDLDFIVERIEFEKEIEGRRLSKPKYVQQLAVLKLLQHYAKLLPLICETQKDLIPAFVDSLTEYKMSEAATQVVLASLHSHWKLPRWCDEFGDLIQRYNKYEHYTEKQYKFPDIDVDGMGELIGSVRDDAISWLGNREKVTHIFEAKHNDELPDHFGQIYFELAEACISALEKNDENKLNKVLPLFMHLTFLAADLKFIDPTLDVNHEYRLHLISSVINDLASVLGFAILYGEYFDNKNLSEKPLALFNRWIDLMPDKQQYFKRMIVLSNPYSFSMSSSPRGMIRIKWKMSFEHRARQDGYGDQMGLERRRTTHPNKIVREFLRSISDASHLFFAQVIMPQLTSNDFDIDHHIESLSRRLNNGDER